MLEFCHHQFMVPRPPGQGSRLCQQLPACHQAQPGHSRPLAAWQVLWTVLKLPGSHLVALQKQCTKSHLIPCISPSTRPFWMIQRPSPSISGPLEVIDKVPSCQSAAIPKIQPLGGWLRASATLNNTAIHFPQLRHDHYFLVLWCLPPGVTGISPAGGPWRGVALVLGSQ